MDLAVSKYLRGVLTTRPEICDKETDVKPDNSRAERSLVSS